VWCHGGDGGYCDATVVGIVVVVVLVVVLVIGVMVGGTDECCG
jgi:hypothetical protein